MTNLISAIVSLVSVVVIFVLVAAWVIPGVDISSVWTGELGPMVDTFARFLSDCLVAFGL
jgi:hypothetical protein